MNMIMDAVLRDIKVNSYYVSAFVNSMLVIIANSQIHADFFKF
jgi:hypothetical protein